MSDNLMEENIGGTASEDVIASQMSDENIKEEEVSTQISEPLDPNALLEVRNLKKYFPAKIYTTHPAEPQKPPKSISHLLPLKQKAKKKLAPKLQTAGKRKSRMSIIKIP